MYRVLIVPVSPAVMQAGFFLDGRLFEEPGASAVLDNEEQAAMATSPVNLGQCEKPPSTLPRFEPFSPEFCGSSADARLKVRLARLQLETEEKEMVHRADYDLRDRC